MIRPGYYEGGITLRMLSDMLMEVEGQFHPFGFGTLHRHWGLSIQSRKSLHCLHRRQNKGYLHFS
jgi:hypothetical protein